MTGTAGLVQPDVHVGQQAQADLVGVDERHVLFDEALLFKPADAPQAGTGRQRYTVGQFLVAQAAIALQFGQNPEICPIKPCVRHF
ncbi:hypothetical protein D3C72_2002840 [compost metagenome]